jgi:hypothetical protein
LGGDTTRVVGVGYGVLFRNRANEVVAIGADALPINTLGTANVAVGRSALGAATTAAATVTISAAGTGGTPGTYTGVQLTYVSGATAVTYPTADIVVGAGGNVTTVTIVSGGTGFTATSGTVMTAASASIGNTTGFTCTLATVNTAASNTAVGHQAGLLQTTASNNTLVGANAGDAITTGNRNTAVGQNALGALTTGTDNIQIGVQASPTAITGLANTIIGNTNTKITSGARNTIVGSGQIDAQNGPGATLTTGSRNILIGHVDVPTASTSDAIIIGSGANNGNYTPTEGTNSTTIGTPQQTSARVFGGTFLSTGANGQSTQLGQSTTLLSALSGATVTATNLIPANCILLGVTARVTTAITGATSFDIGDGTTANRFGDDIAIALNTTANNCIAPALITAATNVVLTANGSNFTGGAVRLTAHFMTLVAPTS